MSSIFTVKNFVLFQISDVCCLLDVFLNMYRIRLFSFGCYQVNTCYKNDTKHTCWLNSHVIYYFPFNDSFLNHRERRLTSRLSIWIQKMKESLAWKMSSVAKKSAERLLPQAILVSNLLSLLSSPHQQTLNIELKY